MTQSAGEKTDCGPIHELDARRAYYIFLTHIRKAHAAGLRWPVHTVIEIGVGTSLGVGLMCLLTGCDRYIGLDAVEHADVSSQRPLLDELRSMIIERLPALNDNGQVAFEFPRYAIPDHAIESNLYRSVLGDSRIVYEAPYSKDSADRYAEMADFLFSTATLEHVADMASGYHMFHRMLKWGAMMSHSIDFKSHGFGKPYNGKWLWNSHWLMKKDEWTRLTAGKAYSINRLACSEHLRLMLESKFELKLIEKRFLAVDSELKWPELSPEFQYMTEEDLRCSGVHVIAIKPACDFVSKSKTVPNS